MPGGLAFADHDHGRPERRRVGQVRALDELEAVVDREQPRVGVDRAQQRLQRLRLAPALGRRLVVVAADREREPEPERDEGNELARHAARLASVGPRWDLRLASMTVDDVQAWSAGPAAHRARSADAW